MTNRRDSTLALLLFLASCAVYAHLLGFDFVRYDDGDYVTANPHVLGGLTASGVHWAFTTPFIGNWQPLTWLSHMLDVELFGLAAGGHHATSVLLHALNGVLVFAVLAFATGARGRSAVVAAIFALHPLHVESVAWVSERKDVLSTFFGLLAMGAYVWNVRYPSRLARLATVVAFGFGLLAKAMLVTLPFVFLLLDRWPLERRLSKRLLVEKLPLFALAAGFVAVTVGFQIANGSTSANELLPFWQRAANAAVACTAYLADAFWPSGLALLYPHPYLPHTGGSGLAVWQIAGAAALIVAISVAAWRSQHGYAATGWLWFLGMLLPVLGLVQMGVQGRADRYTYLPLVGLAVPVVWGFYDLVVKRLGEPQAWQPLRRAIAASALAALLAVTASLGWRQSWYWADSRALYQRAVDVHPRHATMRVGLGEVLASAGDLAGAEASYRAALEIAPDMPEAHANLGNLLLARGGPQAALPHYEAALRLAPDSNLARSNHAGALAALGRHTEAIAIYRAILADSPELAEVHYNLGNALLATGPESLAAATSEFREAVRLQPGLTSARFNLAHCLATLGELEAAIEQLRIVERELPGDARVRAALEHTRLALASAH